jgi:hypothetical protein
MLTDLRLNKSLILIAEHGGATARRVSELAWTARSELALQPKQAERAGPGRKGRGWTPVGP